MNLGYNYDLLCIGSGPAGQRAAVQAAKNGKRAAVIERSHTVGGVCTDTGTIPSKTFREAVLFFSERRDRSLALERTSSVKRATAEQLLTRVDSVIRRQTGVVEGQLRRNDVTMLHGDASFADPHTILVTSEEGSRADRFSGMTAVC